MLAVICLVNFIILYLLFKARAIKQSGKIKLENESVPQNYLKRQTASCRIA